MDILDFLSPEAGQRRRHWLNQKEADFGGVLNNILGPQVAPKVQSAARFADMFNPVTGVAEAMQGGRQAVEGEGWDRVQGIGRMTSGMAATLAPMAGKADDAAKLIDALVGWSPARQGAADEAARFVGDESGAIKAFHGSPHDFDKFSMDRIGTGEGAQAYGHGLYFADNEAVARSYRNALADDEIVIGGKTFTVPARGGVIPPQVQEALGLKDAGGDYTREVYDAVSNARFSKTQPLAEFDEIARQTIAEIEDDLATATGEQYRAGTARFLAQEKDRLARLRAAMVENDVKPFVNTGRMYEVNINADPDDFLDWDAPLVEQSPNVREVLSPHIPRVGRIDEWGVAENPLAAQFPDNPTGGEIVKQFPEFGYGAESILQEKGIPGIKYLDQGSRAAGDGSRNYVVFDDKLIDIVKKYGIAAAAPMLGMSVPEAQQAWEQHNAKKGILDYLGINDS